MSNWIERAKVAKLAKLTTPRIDPAAVSFAKPGAGR